MIIDVFQWFQLDAIPKNVIVGFYNPGLVVLSYIVAVLASYVALNLAGNLNTERKKRPQLFLLIGGAFALGAGIWSMHFIGMLAFIMPMPMKLEFNWTAGSLLAAILASALALYLLQKKNSSTGYMALGGILIGIGIATMHYMGMEGMKDHVSIHYLPSLFILSIVIAIGAAEAALWLAVQSNIGTNRQQHYYKAFSALIMGIAICGMHYMGMAAAVFTPKPEMHMAGMQIISAGYLAFCVAGITALILSLALTTSMYKKKMDSEKDFLNTMLNNLNDGIIACNAAGRITVINKVLARELNKSLVGKSVANALNFFSLYTAGYKLAATDFPLKKVLEGGKIHNLPFTMEFKNNIRKEVLIDGQEIMNGSGKKLGAVIVIHDVTEIKRTEKLKKEFVSIVSHELRTPLTSIRGSLGLLVSGVMGEFPDKAKKLLDIANNNCERLLLLINDILDIEKIEAGKMSFQMVEKDLEKLLIESLENNKMYADKYQIQFKFTPLNQPMYVNVDPDRLMQVLSNLISNACKFSPVGSEVDIWLRQTSDSAQLSISNYGPEIPQEFQARIFQKFSQADSSSTRGKGGTGLGLNISKIIIEKLGGILYFNTSPERTTFTFELPLLKKLNKVENRFCIDKNKKRLLICEDDVDQAGYLKILLTAEGFIVEIAYTAKEARALLEQHRYEALLLDLILPDQDGIAFIRELRADKKNENLSIIVLSVIAETGRSLLTGDALKVADWLEKPIDFNKVMACLSRLT